MEYDKGLMTFKDFDEFIFEMTDYGKSISRDIPFKLNGKDYIFCFCSNSKYEGYYIFYDEAPLEYEKPLEVVFNSFDIEECFNYKIDGKSMKENICDFKFVD